MNDILLKAFLYQLYPKQFCSDSNCTEGSELRSTDPKPQPFMDICCTLPRFSSPLSEWDRIKLRMRSSINPAYFTWTWLLCHLRCGEERLSLIVLNTTELCRDRLSLWICSLFQRSKVNSTHSVHVQGILSGSRSNNGLEIWCKWTFIAGIVFTYWWEIWINKLDYTLVAVTMVTSFISH